MAELFKKIAIIGAGPAGLTAAYEILQQTDLIPLVFELSEDIGGISKTVNYRGNRIDIGGHRFFSKSDRVMNWWSQFLAVEKSSGLSRRSLKYQGSRRTLESSPLGPDPEVQDEVMLVRSRLSRIYYQRKFYNYPIRFEWSTIRNLGFLQIIRIGLSYLKAHVFPLEEKSLEEFFINRFGFELYQTFFKEYTEKVWGVPCSQIAPDWGAQRIKGLSIIETLRHAWKMLWKRDNTNLAQKETETSLIEYFLYPKYGPGQMWETVAGKVVEAGGKVYLQHQVTALHVEQEKIVAVSVRDLKSGEEKEIRADYFVSTMPVSELVSSLNDIEVPADVLAVAQGLPFRDFITVGLLLTKLKVTSINQDSSTNFITDNWIYIQEPEVKVGRLQIFNNWSPWMVKDQNTVWVGLEYFVNEGDETWTLSDQDMIELGIEELSSIGIINTDDVLDGTVLRVKKTYPAYFGSYQSFDLVQSYLDKFTNLFLIGRNGMHRYNNQDHSMLTAMAAVENIRDGVKDKANIWAINVEQDYHESM